MAAGHRHDEALFALNTQNLERLLKLPEVIQQRWKWRKLDRSHDIPYLAGYSEDGDTIYIDQHVPDIVPIEFDGTVKQVDVVPFLRAHEEFEKTLIEVLNYHYWAAHKAATAMEKREVLMRLGPQWWVPYQDKMETYVKADEHERLQKIPKDLDLTPYFAPPVDRALLAHLEKMMGNPNKFGKDDVHYTNTRGGPGRRCGPVQGWPTSGVCGHWHGPNRCLIVRGIIEARGLCDKWESKAHELAEHHIKHIESLQHNPKWREEMYEEKYDEGTDKA